MACDPLWMNRPSPLSPLLKLEQDKYICEMKTELWATATVQEREREYVKRMTIQSTDNHVPTVDIQDESVWSDEELDVDTLEEEVEQELMTAMSA